MINIIKRKWHFRQSYQMIFSTTVTKNSCKLACIISKTTKSVVPNDLYAHSADDQDHIRFLFSRSLSPWVPLLGLP
ncbi:hypothetical protein Hanom_Chr14g01291451 [Helianthus anomalus]